MSTAAVPAEAPRRRVERALRHAMVPFPWLAGLAAAASVTVDARVPTMGVFASGRIVANATFVARLDDADLLFVVAHEMLHLALRTHRRSIDSDRMAFNVAHDYIINDLLRDELGTTGIPAGGLDMPGARLRSAEEVLLEMRRQSRAQGRGDQGPRRVWIAVPGEGGEADDNDGPQEGDVLLDATEREWFGESRDAQRERRRRTEGEARRGVVIARATGALRGSLLAQMGLLPGGHGEDVDAERGRWRVPPELALQRWLESVALGARTYDRAPRRSAGSTDVVLAGRRREGRQLVVVLDTSASMSEALAPALGALADACDALGIDAVRLVQCDAAVTSDVLVEPADLVRRRLDGWGGTDLTPAFEHLADDPGVQAVVALTDGELVPPDTPPPWALAWLLPPGASPAFAPPHGHVLRLTDRESR
ncbi:MAG: VWA-like domain-containing protein [Burkholderiaceae bacterium]